jgi:hypothetical protein
VAVGVENEAPLRPEQIGAMILHQHHPQRRGCIFCCGGKRNGFGIVDLVTSGLGKPFIEQRERRGIGNGVLGLLLIHLDTRIASAGAIRKRQVGANCFKTLPRAFIAPSYPAWPILIRSLA